MKIFNRNFWGTVLIWAGAVIFLVVIYDIIRPVFPDRSPYPFIRSIQSFLARARTIRPKDPAARTRPAPARKPQPPTGRSFPRDSRMLTASTYTPGNHYSHWVWEVKPEHRTGEKVLVEMAHAAEGDRGGFRIIAYADLDGDGKPDRKVAESEFLTADGPGRWSAFKFSSGEEPLFIGSSWEGGRDTVIFRENGDWPGENSPLKGRFFFKISGPSSRSAGPAYTNLRVSFSD